jgi:hypothetical protein
MLKGCCRGRGIKSDIFAFSAPTTKAENGDLLSLRRLRRRLSRTELTAYALWSVQERLFKPTTGLAVLALSVISWGIE